MVYVWMIIAGVVALALVGLFSFMLGVGTAQRQQNTDQLKKLGVTREGVKIFQEAIAFIANLTQHASLNDALAPIEEQTLLSNANKKRAGELLTRYKKEIS